MAPSIDTGLTGSQSMTIHLLGLPQVSWAGSPTPQPRGRKVWGLLAYLTLAERPPTRRLLSDMLFPDADDPLGALRWNISELRRMLGDHVELGGDPVALHLPAGTLIDFRVVLSGSWMEAVRLPGLGRDLLEGLHFDSAPVFELWLTNERALLDAAAEAILREATLASLARGHQRDALGYATRLVSLNPYDENAHVLLARALVDRGDFEGAERVVDKATRLFREELGHDPSPSFRLAALSHRAASVADPSPSGVAAQIEAGEAAINAGAWLRGVEVLRGATIAVAAVKDDAVGAQAHLKLGSALVHAARGFDEEGAKNLYQANSLAERAGLSSLAAQARRELAYIELLRGRYERAFSWLDEAELLVNEDDPEFAWIAAVRGACESDIASYDAARRSLEAAVACAIAVDEEAAAAFAYNFRGRLNLLLMDLDAARSDLNRSLEMARSAGWTAFVPFPMSLMAEAALLSGQLETAGEEFDHAFVLSSQLGDPCWESLGARGLGLVAAATDDMASAMVRLDEAPRLCRRFPDSYLWVEAYALEALCRVAVKSGAPGAPAMVQELESMAARTGMRELLARAMMHRAALGESQALGVAESLVDSIDNPALVEWLHTVRT